MEARRLELPGRRVLLVRPMEESDAPALAQLYAGLCEDDLYKRFFSYRPPPASFIENMARVGGSGGFGVVAVLQDGGAGEIVGEASFSPLPDGNSEVGITVAACARGWLGPYLLDVLVEEARRRGVPNLEAEVLATNRQMQAILEARGSAVIDHSDRPSIVRLCIGTEERSPAWDGAHRRPRLLVEAAGGRWRAADEARRAGFEVLICPGPRRKLARCPAMAGRPCPLAGRADVIVDAVRDEPGRLLLEAHRKLHPAVPVCVDVGSRRSTPEGEESADDGEPDGRIDSGMDDGAVVRLLQDLARRVPAG